MLGSGPSGSCWLGGTGRPTPVSPNGPSVAATATFRLAAVAVAAEAAIKARLFMFPPLTRCTGTLTLVSNFDVLLLTPLPSLPGQAFPYWGGINLHPCSVLERREIGVLIADQDVN